MKPQQDFRNGDEGAEAHDEDSEGEEALALERELSLEDEEAPRRALAALNALRKSRQHFDTVLLAGGAELPAHRAVLAAASPYLLEALPPCAGAAAPAACRVEGVGADALRDLLEYAYTGRLAVRSPDAARRLYLAAWRLRMDAVRAHLAERLLRRLSPAAALELRALPDLAPAHRSQLDAYLAQHFADVCASGALAALPLVRIEMLREASADGGEEAPAAVAEAALDWLRDHNADADLDELCSRTHLVYVDAGGALRDCGGLPAAHGDAPELAEYRREAAERARAAARRAAPAPPPAAHAVWRATHAPPALELGERAPRAHCDVIAACRVEGGGRGTRALLALRGRLAAALVARRDVRAGGGAGGAGRLGGAREAAGARRAALAGGRAALGAVALGGALLALGGYDRARVLSAAERYEPAADAWAPLPDMRSPRARFPAVAHEDTVYVIGGSDGHAELDTVEALSGGKWRAETRLPLALAHAAAVLCAERAELLVLGGWAGGAAERRAARYCLRARTWADAPSLASPRAQAAAARWRGAAWALGGADAWRCLASTERLADGAPAWAPGPPLPAPRRAAAACAWRGALLLAGGSDGAASLRRTEWLAGGEGEGDTWRAGPALRRSRAGLGLAPLADALYAVGGFDGKEFLACVECLADLGGEWTALRSDPAPPPPLPAADGAADADADGAAERAQ